MLVGRFAGVSIATALLSLFLLSCSPNAPEKSSPRKPAASAEPLRICSGTTYSILLTVAEQKGLFAKKGLTVEMKPYALGRDAMEAMIAGTCDVATSADTPVADYGLKRDDLRVISGIATSDRLFSIVAMRSSGIRKVSDLKGRRVGVTKGTAPHFSLNLVLNKNLLTERDLKLQFMKGEELHKAFRDGAFDAIATTDMNAFKLEEQYGERVVLIDEPGIALNHGYLTVLEPTLKSKQTELKRMLAALKAAERIITEDQNEARKLFETYLKVSPSVSSKVWANITPKLSLNSAMVLTLEDNARWLREREGEKQVNKSFRSIIRTELLKEVSPESVTF